MENIKKINNFLEFEVVCITKEQDIDKFAKQNNLNENQIVFENKKLSKGEYVVLNDINKILHIVRPLETIESISKKYNVSSEYIKQKNKISKIFIGQQLYI